jgi:predicted lipoprotein with Yx(FWY)xxD motif
MGDHVMMRIATGFAALLALSTAAFAAPAMEGDTAKGKVLVDEKGMTLYIFDKDEPNKTNCYDQCAVNWPPLMAGEGAMAEGDWTIVDRTDGTKMWAYKGKPVYLWIKDTKPGDITGDGVGGVWHLATP